MLVETEAIVLQVRKFSDTSKIVVLFSKEFGKISVIAKGAFGAKSKFGGLEPLSYANISFYKKSNSDLHLLKTSEFVCHFNNIVKTYDALIAGLITLEIVNNTQKNNFQNAELFVKLVDFLKLLNEKSEFAFEFCVNFLFFLAKNLGYNINFDIKNIDFSNSNNFKNNNEIKVWLSDATVINPLENQKVTSFNFDKTYGFKLETMKKIFELKNINLENINSEETFSKINQNEFLEILFFFINFFSYHLGKKISIKSINLLQ